MHSVELKDADRIEDADVGSRIPPCGEILEADGDDLQRSRAEQPLIVRPPCERDAADIWRLVEACEELDLNSPYAYLLMCTDFAETALVARARSDLATGAERPRAVEGPDAQSPAGEDDQEGELVAFVLGYQRPVALDTLFVWQIGVAEAHRKKGMGAHLLDALVDRCRARSPIEFLEATVTPSNLPSRVLFTRFARDRSARMHERVAFWSSSFPKRAEAGDKPHEDEVRLRIGPIRRNASGSC